MMSHLRIKPYTDTAYHNEELKSLTRYRFDKVQERAKLKQSDARLVRILFPELDKLVPTLHMASVYTLLNAFADCPERHHDTRRPHRDALQSRCLPALANRDFLTQPMTTPQLTGHKGTVLLCSTVLTPLPHP